MMRTLLYLSRHHQPQRLLSAALLLVSASVTPLTAQRPHKVSDAVACTNCRISLTRVVTLGEARGATRALGTVVAAKRDSRGYYYVVYDGKPYEVVVHGPDGAVQRRIGSRGADQGQFRRITTLQMGVGDTLHVFDGINLRRSIFSPSGAYVRSTPMPASTLAAVVLPNDELLSALHLTTREHAGLPLHHLTSSGAIRQSFGADNALLRPDQSAQTIRLLAGNSDETFWVSRINEFRVELRSARGDVLRAFTRTADWFPHWLRVTRPSPSEPPQVRVMGIAPRTDSLWILVRLPDRRWRSSLVSAKSESGADVHRVEHPQLAFDTRIEVLNTRTARLVAVEIADHAFIQFLDAQHVLGTESISPGERRLTVWRLQLVP